MIKISLTLAFLVIWNILSAQEPVHWTYTAKKITDTSYDLHITANIEEGWHIYAQKQPEDAVSQATVIQFNSHPLVTYVGLVKEEGKVEVQKLLSIQIEQYFYANQVEFVQHISLRYPVKSNISGTIKYQACTDRNCLPPRKVDFVVSM